MCISSWGDVVKLRGNFSQTASGLAPGLWWSYGLATSHRGHGALFNMNTESHPVEHNSSLAEWGGGHQPELSTMKPLSVLFSSSGLHYNGFCADVKQCKGHQVSQIISLPINPPGFNHNLLYMLQLFSLRHIFLHTSEPLNVIYTATL